MSSNPIDEASQHWDDLNRMNAEILAEMQRQGVTLGKFNAAADRWNALGRPAVYQPFKEAADDYAADADRLESEGEQRERLYRATFNAAMSAQRRINEDPILRVSPELQLVGLQGMPEGFDLLISQFEGMANTARDSVETFESFPVGDACPANALRISAAFRAMAETRAAMKSELQSMIEYIEGLQ